MLLPDQREEGSVYKKVYKTRDFKLKDDDINRYSGKTFFL